MTECAIFVFVGAWAFTLASYVRNKGWQENHPFCADDIAF